MWALQPVFTFGQAVVLGWHEITNGELHSACPLVPLEHPRTSGT